ncbi:hypothetical protein RJ639_039436 [Escallonia herrerae]|uniref:TOG domain-containing protein n=1 Tax=Escallonia herrerae TaxID=1293975 RepID=A0AA88WJJ5_9ASTE|nr:hypothetical protein RJ639_039436 [Escallonia herrerae]
MATQAPKSSRNSKPNTNQSTLSTATPPSRSSSSSLSSHLAMVELKQRVLNSLSKLSDRDTHQIAVEDLEKIVQTLSQDGVVMLLNCLYDATNDPKPAVKKEAIRLLAATCAAHGNSTATHLTKIIAHIVKRLKDSDSGVKDSCRDAIGALSSFYLKGEVENGGLGSVVSLFVKPLFEAMGEQNKGVQAGAALCMAKMIECASDPPASAFQKLCPRICKYLNNPNFLAKAALLPVVASLSQVGAIAPQSLEPLLQSIHECLGSTDWATRKAAADALNALALHSRNLIAGRADSTLTVLEASRFDKKRVSFKAASHTSKGVLDYVHSDVWGPIRHISNGGARYFVTFIDDFSRKVWVYFMKHKSEVFNVFEQWKARVENQTGVKGYRLWDPVAKKKVISRDVVFNEAQMLNTNATSSERQGHTVEIELHEQRTKSTDESTDGSTDELSLEDPEEHPSDSWNLVKDREPRSTNFGVTFDRNGAKGEVSGFVDSDYAGDLDSRRSTTGYVFTFYGGPICWKSVLQSTTALSTTEAEYMALTEAAKEALWLKGLVEELGFKQRGGVHSYLQRGCKVEYIKKIKPVRDSVTDALQLWKNVAGKGGDGSSDDRKTVSHDGENSEPAKLSNSCERRTETSAKDSSSTSSTDSLSKPKGSNVLDKAVGIMKKRAPALTDKEINPEFFQKLEARGLGDSVEVVVAHRSVKSSNSHNEEESEQNFTDSRERLKGRDDGSVNFKYRNIERGDKDSAFLRQRDYDDRSNLNQRESSAIRAEFSRSDVQPEGFLNNKGNWLAIQRQLLQLERQQTHLLNMLQDFMGGSHDGMITLENRVRGLERVVEDMARDLSQSTGRRGSSYAMGFEESSSRSLGKYNGFADYSSTKRGRGGDGRNPYGERFASSDGIVSGMRGRGPSWRSDAPESWDFRTYGRNALSGSRRALGGAPMDVRSPKSEYESDQVGSRRAWDQGAGPVRFGEGPSARSVWQASKDEATLEAIRVAGEDNGTVRTARIAIPELTAEAMGDDNVVQDRDPVWTSWNNAMDAIQVGDMDSAFAEVLSTGDDLLLVKLLDRSGPVVEQLSREVMSEVLHAVAQFLSEQNLFDICLSWIQQLVDMAVENETDVLGIPMEVKREMLLNLNEACSSFDPPEDWEGVAPDQLLLQLASVWEIDLQQLEK